MKTLRKVLLCCLTLGLCGAFGYGMAAMNAYAEEPIPSETTVPDGELRQLSIDGGTIVYSNSTAGGTVRFSPSDGETDYTLSNATDIAFRFKIMHRQVNRPNVDTGLSYMRIKFVGSDTVWGISKEDLRFTFLDASTDQKSTVRVSNGGSGIGGQLNASSGTDGTIYVPLAQLRDGDTTEELGERLTDIADYQTLEIEYVEYTSSSYRWDFAFGDFAVIRQSDGEVTTDVLPFEAEASNDNITLYDVFYDNVTLKVNGSVAEETSEGTYAVDLGEQGTVFIDSDKLFAYDPIYLKSELSDGYGITKVATSVEGIEGYTLSQRDESADNWSYKDGFAGRNKDRSALMTGYTYEGEYYIRKGNHGLYPGGSDELSTLGAQPLNCTIDVTVSPLIALEIIGENATAAEIYYSRLDTLQKFMDITADGDWSDMPDSVEDGKLYLKPKEEAVIVVVPKDGYDFTGLKLNGEVLAESEKIADEETNRISAVSYKVTVTEAGTIEALGLGEEVVLGLDVASEGGSAAIDGKAVSGETYVSNIYKTLTIEAVPQRGYSATVSIIYPPEEEGAEETSVSLTAADDGKYYYQVDGNFTLKIEFGIISYNVTYRLNGGEYASGESNPATITYFDTVTLKDVEKEGYTFLGWRIEGQENYIAELKEVDSDITLIAVFEIEDDVPPTSDSTGTSSENSQGGSTSDGDGCGSSLAVFSILGAFGVAVIAFVSKKHSRRN